MSTEQNIQNLDDPKPHAEQEETAVEQPCELVAVLDIVAELFPMLRHAVARGERITGAPNGLMPDIRALHLACDLAIKADAERFATALRELAHRYETGDAG